MSFRDNKKRFEPHASAVALALALALLSFPPTAEAASSASVQKELDAIAARYGDMESQISQTEARQIELERQQREAQETIDSKAAALRERAGHIYKTGGVTEMLGQLLAADNFGEFVRRIHYMGILGSSDTRLMETLEVAHARREHAAAELDTTRRRQEQLADELRDQREALEKRLDEAVKAEEAARKAAEAELRTKNLSSSRRAQLQATASGAPDVVGAGRFSKFTLPLSPSAFSNTWGAPRGGGRRRHKGTDVMAPCGAPVYAVADGRIRRLSSGGNGGIMLYMTAANGDVFFYAHLRSYAPGIRTGKAVSVGETIGTNGNTGNARRGPCHVHFEWHPGGGRAVNPYPLLNQARS